MIIIISVHKRFILWEVVWCKWVELKTQAYITSTWFGREIQNALSASWKSEVDCVHRVCPTAVVYSNNMGALHTYGSPAITSVVDQHRHDISYLLEMITRMLSCTKTWRTSVYFFPSSTIHSTISNLLKVMPILLLKHLVAFPVLAGVMQIKHHGRLRNQSIAISPAYCLLF